jgi:hypothetical protein
MAAVILLLPLSWVALRCASDELPLLRQSAEAPWIMAPAKVSADLEQWGRADVPVVRFSRRFPAPEAPVEPRLRVSALGDVRVLLNGELLAELPRAGRRGRASAEVELSGPLARTGNELVVEVANATGPALLSLRSEGLEPALVTGPDWAVETEAQRFAGAALADDTRINPRALAVETPFEALRDQRNPLLVLFVLGMALFLAGERWLGDRGPRLCALAAPWLASAAWLQLYLAKFSRIPPAIGFDAKHHVAYALQLASTGALPVATEGWSTYHPPLFYALAAGLTRLGAGEAAWKALPWLAGLGLVWMAWLLARRLCPESPRVQALAALFAATLPVNLYSAAYFSNEALHALLASAGLLAACDLLLRERTTSGRAAVTALVFALAALSKFTVLVTLPVTLFFLLWKLVFVERAGAARTLAPISSFVGVWLAVAGWFYLRSWLAYGMPVVGNWDLPGADQQWWQQPGFHTPAWWLGFGQALVHPYLSAFHSFWDGVYSTFFGDGFIAGRQEPSGRHTFWSYGYMSAGYLLALPAAGLLAFGCVRIALASLGDGPPRLRLALGLLATAGYAVCLAFFLLTVQLPFFGQAKGPYLLMLAAPLSLAFAWGFEALDEGLAARLGRAGRALLYGWLTVYAGALLLSFAA